MGDTFEFVKDCENFREWLESPNLTVEELEHYAITGEILRKPTRKDRSNYNQPPKGHFMEGSTWFHPVTQEEYLYASGCWVKSETDIEKIRATAKRYGIRPYYQGLTKQFKFSVGYTEWVAPLSELSVRAESNTLDAYFEIFTTPQVPYNVNRY